MFVCRYIVVLLANLLLLHTFSLCLSLSLFFNVYFSKINNWFLFLSNTTKKMYKECTNVCMCIRDDHIYVKERVNIVFACGSKKNKICFYGRSYDYVNHAQFFFRFKLGFDVLNIKKPLLSI